MFPIRLTAIAGLAAAAILFVNAAKRAGLIEISAATQLVAPLAQALALILAVDLALVVDVLPNPDTAAKDLGVFNIAGALPFSIAPALAPTILAIGGGSYGVLYAFAGACAIIGAAAVLPVKRVR